MSEQEQVASESREGSADKAPQPFDPTTFRAQIDASVTNRKDFLRTWIDNVAHRVQKPFGAQTDTTTQDRVAVPEDWARTKQKQSQLAFHLPKVVALPLSEKTRESAPGVAAYINWVMRHEVGAHYTVDEVLADGINAAGLMVSVVGVDIRKEKIQVPTQLPPIEGVDPETGLPVALPNPEQGKIMEEVERIVHQEFYWRRISPAAFLWPAEFTGSNWDEAPWLGYETWIPLQEALKLYPSLPRDFKATTHKPNLLSEDIVSGTVKKGNEGYVKAQIVWYKAALYDPLIQHPKHLRVVVFIEGHDKPVVNEDSEWQKFVEESVNPETGETEPSRYLGLCKFPIRVETLTYVSDCAVPPSDSEAARPQVREMIKSRSQMLRQRDSAIPIRWFDVNRLDETIAERIRNGDWMDMIPVNGPGDRVIGEVARANFPRESTALFQIIGGDLDRSWSLSNNQLATMNSTERSATEVRAVQDAGTVRLDYEKERVNRYIVGAAEVLFSLMQLFLNRKQYVAVVQPGGNEVLQAFDRAALAGDYAFDFLPDSSDRIDAVTRQQNLVKLYNLLGNSPSTNKAYVEEQIWIAHGIDPARAVAPPKEPTPPPPNISFRFSGEDMLNPMAVALMNKAGYALTPDDIKGAAQMIQDAIKQMAEAKQRVFGEPAPEIAAAPPTQPTDGAPGPETQPQTTPPELVEPILKRANDGSRLV